MTWRDPVWARPCSLLPLTHDAPLVARRHPRESRGKAPERSPGGPFRARGGKDGPRFNPLEYLAAVESIGAGLRRRRARRGPAGDGTG